MDEILEGLDGVVSIADDVCVHEKKCKVHDANLISLMNRAAEKGLLFNSDKCLIKQESICFLGNAYTAEGIKPGPANVRDIQNMITPQFKEDLLIFLDMITYLSHYIPHFAEKSHAFRGLLKKDSIWTCDSGYQKQINELNEAVSENACLKYYNTAGQLTFEVDASQKGLGAALIQDGRLIAFGSKTLTECQSRYSNIEREMLAMVHGIQRYHTYLCGRLFTVITDHKPLVTISAKPMHVAPETTTNVVEDPRVQL